MTEVTDPTVSSRLVDWATGHTSVDWEVLHASRTGQVFELRSAWSGTDEQMVQLYPHSS
jgi:hypothetical protein